MTEELDKGILIETATDKKVNIVLDMSQFDLFELCQYRYNVRHNLLKAPPKKAEALDKGSLAHEGLDVYFNLLKKGIPFQDRMHEAIKHIQALAADPDQSHLEPEDVAVLISAVEQSCDYWRFEDEQMIIHEIEQAFAFILFEDEFIRIIITGKIDLLVDIPSIGRNSGYSNLPIDHKTYQRDYPLGELSNQFTCYTYAVKSNYIIINRIGLQKTVKPEDKFKRIPLSYDPIKKQQWADNVKDVIIDEYLQCVATGRWKMNFTSCDKFNRKCEYYEVCNSSGIEAKMYKLDSQFATVSPWDVTAKFSKNS